MDKGDLMKRPVSFEDIYGHKNIINLLKARVNENSLPHFLIIYGEEGIGKTSIARLLALALTCESDTKPCYKCDSCLQNTDIVINNGKNSSNVFLYRMSVEGGKDVAKDMITHINSCMGSDVKVFIADEAHRMSSAAQDVLLHDTEHLPSKVFVIMCTTDITSINKTLLSRAVKFYLPHLSRSAMTSLLLKSIKERNLVFPDASQAASLIAEIAEYKPREALAILEGLGNQRYVSYQELNSVLQLNDTESFKTLLYSFNSGITEGITIIYEMDITYQTQTQLCRYISECIKYSQGVPVYLYDVTKDIAKDISVTVLTHFLYYVSNLTTFNTIKLLSAYLLAHPKGLSLSESKPDMLGNELRYMQNRKTINEQPVTSEVSRRRLTAEDLLRESSYVEEG